MCPAVGKHRYTVILVCVCVCTGAGVGYASSIPDFVCIKFSILGSSPLEQVFHVTLEAMACILVYYASYFCVIFKHSQVVI